MVAPVHPVRPEPVLRLSKGPSWASPNPFALSLSINPFALSLSKGRVSKGRSSKNPTKSIPPCVTPGPHP